MYKWRFVLFPFRDSAAGNSSGNGRNKYYYVVKATTAGKGENSSEASAVTPNYNPSGLVGSVHRTSSICLFISDRQVRVLILFIIVSKN